MSLSEQKKLKKKFKTTTLLGRGTYGCVFVAVDPLSKTQVAAKIECRSVSDSLNIEKDFYLRLLNVPGIPQITSLSMERVGSSLADLLDDYQTGFSLSTVLRIAIQLINRLRDVHRRGVIHRDINPGNLAIGRGDKSGVVYILDFGLAGFFVKERGEHIPYEQKFRSWIGTTEYMSLNVNNGVKGSRRDDLESLGYTLIKLYKGSLPWEGVKGTENQIICKIRAFKRRMSLEELCDGLPLPFLIYMTYCRNMEFEKEPDYDFLIQLFQDHLTKTCSGKDSFEWEDKENQDNEEAEGRQTSKCVFLSCFGK